MKDCHDVKQYDSYDLSSHHLPIMGCNNDTIITKIIVSWNLIFLGSHKISVSQ